MLPERYGKPWNEHEFETLAELQLGNISVTAIAKKMDRTTQSVSMQSSLLRKAYRLIPMIERNRTIRDFASIPVSPNPSN